jgi:hypothetical protein
MDTARRGRRFGQVPAGRRTTFVTLLFWLVPAAFPSQDGQAGSAGSVDTAAGGSA